MNLSGRPTVDGFFHCIWLKIGIGGCALRPCPHAKSRA